jgi:hypothetical protein
MQGITKGRHVHMIDALLQLEELLAREQPECGCLQQAKDHRRELSAMYANYENLLEKLAEQISAYEALFGHVKVHVLSKKLKELKKDIPADRAASIPALVMLHHNIQLAYGT